MFCEACGSQMTGSTALCHHCDHHQEGVLPPSVEAPIPLHVPEADVPDRAGVPEQREVGRDTAFCTACRKVVPVGTLVCDDCMPVGVPASPVTPESGRESVPGSPGPGSPTWTGTGASAARDPLAIDLSRVTPAMRGALRDGLSVVVGLYLISLVTGIIALPFIHGSSIVDAIRGAGWLTALTFRGHVIVSGASGSASAAASAYAQPGLLFCGCMVATAYLTRRAERQDPSPDARGVWLVSGALGLGAGVACALIAVVTAGTVRSSSDGSAVSVHVNIISAFIGAFIFTGLAAAITRFALTWRRALLPAKVRDAVDRSWPQVRAIGWFGVAGSALALVCIVLFLVVSRAPIGAWLVAIVDLPFLMLEVLLLSCGVPISTSGSFSALGVLGGSGSAGVGLFSGGLPTYCWLLLIIPIVAIFAAGVRMTVREPFAADVAWDRVLRCMVIGSAAAWAIAYLTSILGGESGGVSFLSGSGTIRVGMGIVASLLVGAAVGALIPLSGFYMARFVGQRWPEIVIAVATMANGRLDPVWARALGEESPTHVDLPRPPRARSASPTPSTLVGAPGDGPAVATRSAAGPTEPPTAPLRRPPRQFRMTPRLKAVLYGIGGLAVVAIAGVIGLNVAASSHSPTAVANAYMQDVASGNASGALATTDGQWTGPWLSAQALAMQDQSSPITHVQVGSATVTGSTAVVPVSYWVGSTPVVGSTVTLRSDGSQNLVFTHWVVTNPVARLSAPGGSISVDGSTTSTSGEPILVFPGAPVLRAGKGSDPYIATSLSGSSNDVVGPGQSLQVATTTQLTSAGSAAVIAAADQSLQQCLSSTSPTPPNCPFSDIGASDYPGVSGVSWSISEMPSLENTTLTLSGNQVEVQADTYGAIEVSCSYSYVDPNLGVQTVPDSSVGNMTSATVTLTSGGTPSVSFQNFD